MCGGRGARYVESVDGKLLRGRVILCYTDLIGFLLKAGHSDKISSVRGLEVDQISRVIRPRMGDFWLNLTQQDSC